MSIKDTLTSNSMESFAFQGKTYTRRVDNGAVVYDISAGTGGSGSASGGGASVTTSPDVPASASDGDLWYDESSAALYVYTDSIDGWVQANGGGGGGAGPRAYVAFDGTSSDLTDSITNSFNVLSITDNSTGYYTVAFTTLVANQVISVACNFDSLNAPMDPSYEILNSNQVEIKIGESETAWPGYAADPSHISLIVF